MAVPQHELRYWFRKKFAQKRMTQVEFRRVFGIPRTTQSMLMSDTNQNRAGLETCNKLAKAFHTPLPNVLEMAGFLPRSEPHTSDERYLMAGYRRIDARDKQTLLVFMESLLELDERPVMPGKETGRYIPESFRG